MNEVIHYQEILTVIIYNGNDYQKLASEVVSKSEGSDTLLGSDTIYTVFGFLRRECGLEVDKGWFLVQ